MSLLRRRRSHSELDSESQLVNDQVPMIQITNKHQLSMNQTFETLRFDV